MISLLTQTAIPTALAALLHNQLQHQVALEFHEMRNAKPGLFFSRIVNKAVYAATGARNIISRNCKDLGSSLKLECDGTVAAVPDDTESIIVLNINSYAGGAKLWTAGQDTPSGAPGATRCVQLS
jgi:Diacylglycerol kinase accessory domain